MAFATVETKVAFPALEREVFAFWKLSDAFNKLWAKNAGRK